jgi:hypothetical protein
MPDPTPAPASPSTPTPAPAAAPKIIITDVTPTQPKVHRVNIPAAGVQAFVATIDSTAPAGKSVRAIVWGFDGNGNATVTITYNP